MTELTANDVEALEDLRVSRNWTYRELAALIGVGLSPLHRTVKQRTRPNARTAYKIRRFLDLQGKRRKSA